MAQKSDPGPPIRRGAYWQASPGDILVQVAEVGSQVVVSPRQAGPLAGSQGWPAAGRATQVFVAASQVAYEAQCPVAGSQAHPTIAQALRAFVDCFNANSLDQVMTFFAEDAVYEPGDGRTHRGRAAIRQAFWPQFSNAYGTMRFAVHDEVIDERGRKATIRWVCSHDFSTVPSFVQRWLFRVLYGQRAGWSGTDTFHFDGRGKIVGKFTYAHYGRRPQVRRDLGTG